MPYTVCILITDIIHTVQRHFKEQEKLRYKQSELQVLLVWTTN